MPCLWRQGKGGNIAGENKFFVPPAVENKVKLMLGMVPADSFQGFKAEPANAFKLVLQQQTGINGYSQFLSDLTANTVMRYENKSIHLHKNKQIAFNKPKNNTFILSLFLCHAEKVSFEPHFIAFSEPDGQAFLDSWY